MSNNPSARKRDRQAEKRRQINVSIKSSVKTALKKVLRLIKEGATEDIKLSFQKFCSIADRASQSGVLHSNKVARHKSRLSQKVKDAACS